MSQTLIFGIGSIMFIAVTWATIAFGVARLQELEVEEMGKSNIEPVPSESGLTEVRREIEDPAG